MWIGLVWQVASSRLFSGAGFDVRLGFRDTMVNGCEPPDGLGITNHDGIGKRALDQVTNPCSWTFVCCDG